MSNNNHELPTPEQLLPHRGIALALDEITELEPGRSATGLWTPDERYFEGHFPAESFLPGHWQTESVALIGACALLSEKPGLLPLFRESQSKYKGQVKPGDTLEVSAEFLDVEEIERGGAKMLIASGRGNAKVDGKIVYQAALLKAVAELE
jgi:3-hydroxymyristoyl/3-hydroxydecanoyl-(acyl carrier protein) dehydratase